MARQSMWSCRDRPQATRSAPAGRGLRLGLRAIGEGQAGGRTALATAGPMAESRSKSSRPAHRHKPGARGQRSEPVCGGMGIFFGSCDVSCGALRCGADRRESSVCCTDTTRAPPAARRGRNWTQKQSVSQHLRRYTRTRYTYACLACHIAVHPQTINEKFHTTRSPRRRQIYIASRSPHVIASSIFM